VPLTLANLRDEEQEDLDSIPALGKNMRPYLKNNWSKTEGLGCDSSGRHLSSKCKALASNSS
jgi:hypothetical protein